MAAPPRLTPEQWAKVKHTWENDPRDSFEWLVRELGLPVAGAAVRKRAKAKGGEWQKQAKASPAKDSGAGNGGRVKRAENATKPAAQAKQESVRDLKGRGSAVGEPEGGEKSPPKGFRKGALPKRRKPVASDVVIDLATGEVDAGEGSQGSSDQGSESQGSQGSGHKWEMNLGDDEYLWRDVAPTVRPIEEDEKRGRPTVYQNIFPNQAFRHCLLGATTGDLALLFQVTERTINRWMVEHKEFCHAVQAGKADADSRVASSVFKRAVGFKVPEAHISNYKGHITITQVDKYYPPDMGAAAMWLYNRQPEKWRANPELPLPDPSSNNPFTAELDAQYQLSMEESRKRAEAAREDRRKHGQFGKRPELDNPEGDLLLEGMGDAD